MFEWPVRVYWEDTDAGGIVFYANYLKFMERARTEWLRQLNIHQQALAEQQGLIFVVTDAQLRYLASARLDDALQVSVEPVEIGRSRLRLRQRCRLGDQWLCDGTISVACIDRAQHRPRRIPTDILARLQPQADLTE
ncbi:tol-pal system-associated acyl-CoA thioesterase [Ideonella sp. 4Y11]|uniref:Tol-pal system-associated acyl-CoA thioesterase n=1 Tax=Ideonella aquatica TaxID=2824119 RepID=A0A940YR49_9BURK|nr:tol-pal system-associated acyl-CoA thioesterase [Ideonella aquatica]MBQ0961372.1 tol-pal system-associated acyl-CoA thioesterase [Ideonella aquatica]